jgi:hypothetical protein
MPNQHPRAIHRKKFLPRRETRTKEHHKTGKGTVALNVHVSM